MCCTIDRVEVLAVARKVCSWAGLRSFSATSMCIGCEVASGPVTASPWRSWVACWFSATKAWLFADVALADAMASMPMAEVSKVRRKWLGIYEAPERFFRGERSRWGHVDLMK